MGVFSTMPPRFSFLLRKFDPSHDARGRFSTTNSQNLRNIRIRHTSRYDEVTESNIESRGDLGYFKDKSPRTIVSPKELYLDPLWQGAEDDIISKMDAKEKAAMEAYTGAGLYSRLNREMAKGKTNDPELHATAKSIYTALNKSKLPEDVTLFRGMRARGVFLEGKEAIGKVYSDKVFKSTSLLNDNAIQFAHGKEPSVIMRIKARKGQRGAYLDGKLSNNPQEQEVLLPHDAKFLIVGHSMMEVKQGKAVSKIHVYDVEML